MIPVTRISEPPVLAKNAARWLEALELIQSNNKATKSQINQAQNKYCNKQKQLKPIVIPLIYNKSKLNLAFFTVFLKVWLFERFKIIREIHLIV